MGMSQFIESPKQDTSQMPSEHRICHDPYSNIARHVMLWDILMVKEKNENDKKT